MAKISCCKDCLLQWIMDENEFFPEDLHVILFLLYLGYGVIYSFSLHFLLIWHGLYEEKNFHWNFFSNHLVIYFSPHSTAPINLTTFLTLSWPSFDPLTFIWPSLDLQLTSFDLQLTYSLNIQFFLTKTLPL